MTFSGSLFWFICVVEKRREHAACPYAPSNVFVLSSFTLVLLYFSSLILFSFSTLPLCSEDLLALVRTQGLEQPAALLKFDSYHNINCTVLIPNPKPGG